MRSHLNPASYEEAHGIVEVKVSRFLVSPAALGVAIEATLALPSVRVTYQSSLVSETAKYTCHATYFPFHILRAVIVRHRRLTALKGLVS